MKGGNMKEISCHQSNCSPPPSDSHFPQLLMDLAVRKLLLRAQKTHFFLLQACIFSAFVQQSDRQINGHSLSVWRGLILVKAPLCGQLTLFSPSCIANVYCFCPILQVVLAQPPQGLNREHSFQGRGLFRVKTGVWQRFPAAQMHLFTASRDLSSIILALGGI